MTKKQILFINGWVSKENYKDYIDYLNKLEYNPFKDKLKKWRHHFVEDMWKDYEIINPAMPNKHFASYIEWKIMFEKTFPYLKDDIILLGHSQGATFIVKYLEENIFPKKIKKIILLAWAFKDSDLELLWDFNFDKKLQNFKKYENKIIFFHSKDDPVVSYNDLSDFKTLFPLSKYNIFENKGHFLWEDFIELINEIKKI